MKEKFFVVMPFSIKEAQPAAYDQDGKMTAPAVQINFDRVYDKFIRPALLAADCEPFRADEETGAGDIRTDMFFELITADFILADISILNPNVFYELGVRHGVAPRGVLVIHGGWSRQPFDVAPDRTFHYNGALFQTPIAENKAWQQRVDQEIEQLAERIRVAVAHDDRGVGSPVYKELAGLKPVDWSGIQTAKAKYFQGILDDWQSRVRVARKEGYPGDVLTLAKDAPTRYHHIRLLSEAAKALIDLNRMSAAQSVLEEILEENEDHFEARCQLALALARLGHHAESEEEIRSAIKLRPNDQEAQGILGRVYKDMWRSRWQGIEDLAQRQQMAMDYASIAAKSAQCYANAFQQEMNSYYVGINLLSLHRLLEHLNEATGAPALWPIEQDPKDIATIVRFAAMQAWQQARDSGQVEGETWASASLGELELLIGSETEAIKMYQNAGALPNITFFQLESMRGQLELYNLLGFRPTAVTPIMNLLARFAQNLPKTTRHFDKVILFNGLLTDKPESKTKRFPAKREAELQQRLADKAEQWQIGENDLVMCSGTRGSDILFAEVCRRRGAHVRLLVPLPLPEFLEKAVRAPEGNWEIRLNQLLHGETAAARCEVWFQHERLGSPAERSLPFARNNQWMIDTARVEASPGKLLALLVWDENPDDDEVDSTADFAGKLEQTEAIREIIKP